jgi:RsiW-degrading membrane proteinase PrsW (M82 family)
MNKKILYAAATIIAALLPAIASAISLCTMADAVKNVILYVGWVLVVIAWVATGILYLTSFARGSDLKSANTALVAAIVGTIVVLIAANAASFVGNSFGLDSAPGGSCSG